MCYQRLLTDLISYIYFLYNMKKFIALVSSVILLATQSSFAMAGWEDTVITSTSPTVSLGTTNWGVTASPGFTVTSTTNTSAPDWTSSVVNGSTPVTSTPVSSSTSLGTTNWGVTASPGFTVTSTTNTSAPSWTDSVVGGSTSTTSLGTTNWGTSITSVPDWTTSVVGSGTNSSTTSLGTTNWNTGSTTTTSAPSWTNTVIGGSTTGSSTTSLGTTNWNITPTTTSAPSWTNTVIGGSSAGSSTTSLGTTNWNITPTTTSAPSWTNTVIGGSGTGSSTTSLGTTNWGVNTSTAPAWTDTVTNSTASLGTTNWGVNTSTAPAWTDSVVNSNDKPEIHLLTTTNIRATSAMVLYSGSNESNEEITYTICLSKAGEDIDTKCTATTKNEFSMLTGLTASTSYTWKVKASDKNGVTVSLDTRSFTTLATDPINRVPEMNDLVISNIFTTTADLAWKSYDPNGDIVYSAVCVSENRNAATYNCIYDTAGSNYELRNLRPGTTYYVTIRGTDVSSDGYVTYLSEMKSFKTLGNVGNTAPKAKFTKIEPTATGVNLEWTLKDATEATANIDVVVCLSETLSPLTLTCQNTSKFKQSGVLKAAIVGLDSAKRYYVTLLVRETNQTSVLFEQALNGPQVFTTLGTAPATASTTTTTTTTTTSGTNGTNGTTGTSGTNGTTGATGTTGTSGTNGTNGTVGTTGTTGATGATGATGTSGSNGVTTVVNTGGGTVINNGGTTGSGGGGITVDTSPITLPATDQDRDVIQYGPVSFALSNGRMTLRVLHRDYQSGFTATWQLGTLVTNKDGTAFTGTYLTPTIYEARKLRTDLLTQIPAGVTMLYPYFVQYGRLEEKYSKPVILSGTLPEDLTTLVKNTNTIQIRAFDFEQNGWVKVGDASNLSGKRFSVPMSKSMVIGFFDGNNGTAVPATDSATAKIVSTKMIGDLNELEVEQLCKGQLSTFKPTPFADVVNHWSEYYVCQLYHIGAISGYEAGVNLGQFKPDNTVTRAEFLKTVMLTNGYDVRSYVGKPSKFKDVDSNSWYAPYLAKALELGVVEGYSDGNFKPNATINRAEAMKMVLLSNKSMTKAQIDQEKALQSADSDTTAEFTDVNESSWFAPYVSFAKKRGIISGKADGKFYAGDNLTRGEMAKIVYLSFVTGR